MVSNNQLMNEGASKDAPLHPLECEAPDIFAEHESIELDETRLPAFLRRYLDITGKITDAKSGARLTALLPALAVNIGNRVFAINAGNRIYPNVWTVIIGPSTTTRKSTAINLAKATLRSYEDRTYEMEEGDYSKQTLVLTNTTSSKLLNLLSQQPNRLFVHNELSGFMAEMGKLYNNGMKQTITDLYDGCSRTYFTMEREEKIKDPSLSILSASTEGWYLSLLGNQTEQLSGFTQRFIYCVIRQVNVEELDTDYKEGYEHYEELNQYETMYETMRRIPDKFRLRMTPDTIAMRNKIYREKLKEVQKMKNDSLLSYFSRIYDGYFFKFCIIFTLYDNHETLKQFIDYGSADVFFEKHLITEETAKQAFYLCDYYFENTLPLLKIMSEHGKLIDERKFANLLRDRFGGHASHSQMMQYGHFTAKSIKSVVDTLLEMNVITQEIINPGNGKKAYRYHLNPKYLR